MLRYISGWIRWAAFNDNNDALKHATDLRGLTKLPGKPAVLVAAHPVKNASRDNLEPYGGGSVMNEFDGNLTLWADGKSVELGWNKVRGPEFETRFFSIEKLGSPDIKDSKGRTPNFPVLRPTSVETVEQRASAEASSDIDLIREMAANPNGTQEDWGRAIRCSKGAVNKKLQKLAASKFATEGVGRRWRLTPKGKKELE
jgi:hypothetical protein